MNCSLERYECQIGRCTRLISILTNKNLVDVISVVRQLLADMEHEKYALIEGGVIVDVYSFECNMRAMHMLLEYPDIFVLSDINRYKQACECAIHNFKKCIQ